jgi:hypothetical protein
MTTDGWGKVRSRVQDGVEEPVGAEARDGVAILVWLRVGRHVWVPVDFHVKERMKSQIKSRLRKRRDPP